MDENGLNMTIRWLNLFKVAALIYVGSLISVLLKLCTGKCFCFQLFCSFLFEVALPMSWLALACLMRYSPNGKTIAGDFIEDPLELEKVHNPNFAKNLRREDIIQGRFVMRKSGLFLHIWMIIECAIMSIVAIVCVSMMLATLIARSNYK